MNFATEVSNYDRRDGFVFAFVYRTPKEINSPKFRPVSIVVDEDLDPNLRLAGNPFVFHVCIYIYIGTYLQFSDAACCCSNRVLGEQCFAREAKNK